MEFEIFEGSKEIRHVPVAENKPVQQKRLGLRSERKTSKWTKILQILFIQCFVLPCSIAAVILLTSFTVDSEELDFKKKIFFLLQLLFNKVGGGKGWKSSKWESPALCFGCDGCWFLLPYSSFAFILLSNNMDFVEFNSRTFPFVAGSACLLYCLWQMG